MINVTFKLNEPLDIQMAIAFDYYPEMKSTLRHSPEGKEIIKAMVQELYEQYGDELVAAQSRISSAWNSVSSKALELIDDLFMHHPFPSTESIAYISLFDNNPRFIEDSSFQVYYKRENSNNTIAHELLHFIFFDFTDKNIAKVSTLSKNDGIYWHVSEIFNNVVLGTPKFKKLLSSKGDTPYPEHLGLLTKAQVLYKDHPDLIGFIESLINLVGNSELA